MGCHTWLRHVSYAYIQYMCIFITTPGLNSGSIHHDAGMPVSVTQGTSASVNILVAASKSIDPMACWR